MGEQFKCSSCKGVFDIKEKGYFSPSQGNLCKKCWSKINKEQNKNIKKEKEMEEREFERKVRKVIK